ncbi:MAG: protein-L-isoaspartate O-methyltransferase family protein, partial [Ktedonobacteraceae bacterium]
MGCALFDRLKSNIRCRHVMREAFLTVPRHAFLTPSIDGVHEQWLNEVYQDTAILTKQDACGKPLSSSSQPSIMVLMLESLEVQPAMRVLEIGTGTGYNAALLAHLAGSPAQITTIDIDPALTALARSRIENVIGAGMCLFTGDGRLGVPNCGPYDRIIAT